MANKNSNKKDTKGKSKNCPFCGGSGKIRLRCDDTNMELLCPICQGSGKRRPHLRPVYLRFKQLPTKIPVPRRQGGGGRISRIRCPLLPPGTPLVGYPEGNMIPQSTPETVYPYEDIRYPIFHFHEKRDDDEEPDDYREDEPTGHGSEIILQLPEGITIGHEFSANLVLDSDFTMINFQDDLETGSEPVTARIVYGVNMDECLEEFSWENNPLSGKPTVLELKSDDRVFHITGELSTVSKNEIFVFENKDQLIVAEHYQENIETEIYGSGIPSGIKIENIPDGQLTLSPHQSNRVASMDVLGPAMSGQVNPLDVSGVQDPLGVDISTDVIG